MLQCVSPVEFSAVSTVLGDAVEVSTKSACGAQLVRVQLRRYTIISDVCVYVCVGGCVCMCVYVRG